MLFNPRQQVYLNTPSTNALPVSIPTPNQFLTLALLKGSKTQVKRSMYNGFTYIIDKYKGVCAYVKVTANWGESNKLNLNGR